MNREQLVKAVTGKTGLSKKDVESVVATFQEVVIEAASNGDSVAISGFGQWLVKDTAERQGRNPATGESITIPAGRKVSFKAGKNLRDSIK